MKVIVLEEWEIRWWWPEAVWCFGFVPEREVIKNRLLLCLHVTRTTVFEHVMTVGVSICMCFPLEDDLIGQWTGKSVQN